MVGTVRRVALALLLLLTTAAGCGGGEERERAASVTVRAAATPEVTPPRNLVITGDRGRGEARALAGIHPFAHWRDARRHGRWVWAARSPDGRTLLGQFSGECEIPLAFLVRDGERRARSVTGRFKRAAPPPVSHALGWTTDGRAIVAVPEEAACGAAGRGGLYLVNTDGGATRVGDLPQRMRRSMRPRDARSLLR